MDVRLSVTRNVYKHVGRARIRELQEWFCNLVPSVLIVNQPVEMPHHRYCSSVLYMPQMLQLCTVYAQSITDTAALYCCSSVLSMCSPAQILKLCIAYTTDTAALYCLCRRYCSSILSMPQTLQLCTVAVLYYVQPTTEIAALYCLCADSPSGQCLPGRRVGGSRVQSVSTKLTNSPHKAERTNTPACEFI